VKLRRGYKDGEALALYALVVLLTTADALFTVKLIRRGFIEANPLLASLFQEGRFVSGVLLKVVSSAVLGAVVLFAPFRRARGAYLFLAGMYTAIIMYHIAFINVISK
jgi:hypothetical protein